MAGPRLRYAPVRHSRPLRRLATLKQIHSSSCVAAEGRSGILGEGDALLENLPGGVVAVKTADCIPVLLVDERTAPWPRSTPVGAAPPRASRPRAVGPMAARFGTRPEDVHAAIGPGIGKCCYEVGPEVAAQFGGQGRGHIDLADANRRQLEESGVTP